MFILLLDLSLCVFYFARDGRHSHRKNKNSNSNKKFRQRQPEKKAQNIETVAFGAISATRIHNQMHFMIHICRANDTPCTKILAMALYCVCVFF